MKISWHLQFVLSSVPTYVYVHRILHFWLSENVAISHVVWECVPTSLCSWINVKRKNHNLGHPYSITIIASNLSVRVYISKDKASIIWLNKNPSLHIPNASISVKLYVFASLTRWSWKSFKCHLPTQKKTVKTPLHYSSPIEMITCRDIDLHLCKKNEQHRSMTIELITSWPRT